MNPYYPYYILILNTHNLLTINCKIELANTTHIKSKSFVYN